MGMYGSSTLCDYPVFYHDRHPPLMVEMYLDDEHLMTPIDEALHAAHRVCHESATCIFQRLIFIDGFQAGCVAPVPQCNLA